MLYAAFCGIDRIFVPVLQAFFVRWWHEQDDDMRDVVRGLVASGQLDFVNGGWVQNDEATAHYVGMIDQTTRGHRSLFNRLIFGSKQLIHSCTRYCKSTARG